MPNYCSFGIEIRGPEAKIQEVAEFLKPGIEKRKESSAFAEFFLNLDQVFRDLDSEREHVYLELWGNRASGEWCEIGPLSAEFTAEEVECFKLQQKLLSDEPERPWLTRRYR